MSFICCLFFSCRFSNKNYFHVHVTAQASSGNVIVILLFIRLPTWTLSCHFLTVRRTILPLSNSEYVSYIVISSVLVSETASNTIALHA